MLRWGTPAHAGVAWFTLGNTWAMPGNACSRWGHLVHAGNAWATLGNACSLGSPVLRWGTPGPRWGTPAHAGVACVTLGDAWSTLGNACSRWGRLCYAGERLVHARLGSLLGCWCTRGPLSLSSVIEVKYASRGPPYIAGSELLSRVFWCESQLLIGSSRSMSIRETPECLGCFDVRYTSNPVA